ERGLSASPDHGVVGGESPRAVIHGIFADFVEAPQHLETAVSAVLGDRLEGVVVDGPSIAAKGVELLKREQEGRTTFVPAHLPPTAGFTKHHGAVPPASGGMSARGAALLDGPSAGKPIGW